MLDTITADREQFSDRHVEMAKGWVDVKRPSGAPPYQKMRLADAPFNLRFLAEIGKEFRGGEARSTLDWALADVRNADGLLGASRPGTMRLLFAEDSKPREMLLTYTAGATPDQDTLRVTTGDPVRGERYHLVYWLVTTGVVRFDDARYLPVATAKKKTLRDLF